MDAREYVRAMTARYQLNAPEPKKEETMHPNEQATSPYASAAEEIAATPAAQEKCKHGTVKGTWCPQCFTVDGIDNKHPDPVVTITRSAFIVIAWTPKGMSFGHASNEDEVRVFVPSSVHTYLEGVLKGDAQVAYVGDDDAHTFIVVRCERGAVPVPETPQAVREALGVLHSALPDCARALDVLKRNLP